MQAAVASRQPPPDCINQRQLVWAELLNGAPVAATTSKAFEHSFGKILAFACVAPAAAVPGTALEVVIMWEPRHVAVLAEAACDPANLLPRTDVQ